MFEDGLTTEADRAVAGVLAAGPGPDAGVALAGIDSAGLSGAGRLAALAAWQAQVAWAEAQSTARWSATPAPAG